MAGGTLHAAEHWVERHPYATAGIVFAAGAILIYLYYSGGSSTGGSSADADFQAQLQAQTQQEAIQAQYAAQASAQGTQASIAAGQVNGAVQVAQLEYGASTTQAQLAATTSQAGIAAQESVENAGISEQGTLAGIQATEATNINASNNATTQTQLNDQASYLNQVLAANYNEDYLGVVQNINDLWQSGQNSIALQAEVGNEAANLANIAKG
jgi:hypothetical protein